MSVTVSDCVSLACCIDGHGHCTFERQRNVCVQMCTIVKFQTQYSAECETVSVAVDWVCVVWFCGAAGTDNGICLWF